VSHSLELFKLKGSVPSVSARVLKQTQLHRSDGVEEWKTTFNSTTTPSNMSAGTAGSVAPGTPSAVTPSSVSSSNATASSGNGYSSGSSVGAAGQPIPVGPGLGTTSELLPRGGSHKRASSPANFLGEPLSTPAQFGTLLSLVLKPLENPARMSRSAPDCRIPPTPRQAWKSRSPDANRQGRHQRGSVFSRGLGSRHLPGTCVPGRVPPNRRL